MKNSYDVALWRYFDYGEMPIVAECIHADTPLLAALTLMHHHGLRFAAHAAVACKGCATWRRDRLSLILDESPTAQEVND